MSVDATGDITINADEHGYVTSIDVHILTSGKNEIVSEAKKIAEKYKGRCNLKISRPYSPRSTGPRSQEAHIRGHVKSIADQSAHRWTEDQVHAVMKGLTSLSGRPYPKPKRYRDIPIYASDADLNSVEANSLIETMHEFADKNNFWLIEIDEKKGMERPYRTRGGRTLTEMMKLEPGLNPEYIEEFSGKPIEEKKKDPQPEMVCPKCKHAEPDFDGFGMQHCTVCGYCTHPSYYEGRCGLCGAINPEWKEPKPDSHVWYHPESCSLFLTSEYPKDPLVVDYGKVDKSNLELKGNILGAIADGADKNEACRIFEIIGWAATEIDPEWIGIY
jgi:hypothetical protein